jgi:hypothetical protein
MPSIIRRAARDDRRQLPAHERKARTKGIPVLGSGRVFPIDEDDLKVAAFEIPATGRRSVA